MAPPTAEDELTFQGPGAIAARVRNREVSARDVVEHFLDRIERLDPQLRAFRVVLPEAALAAADALDQRLAADGELELPLAGVPVAIKDDMPLAGQATTRGSRSPEPVAPADAEAVARLRGAGAIPIGVTRVPELTMWPWTATDAGGVTRNPWDLTRTPGGSSGGSAAAVAAGLVPAATASDGAGSIRIPAACCGLVGMKPTRGRVPTLPAAEGWLGLTVFGALARTTADSALLLDVLSDAVDPAGGRPASPETFRAAAGRAPGRLRIAISRRVPPGLVASLASDQRLAFDRTARLLAELGHEVEERDPAYGLAALELTQTYLRGIAEDFARLADPTATERATRQMAAAGRVLVPVRRRDVLRARRPNTSARILELWRSHDVLLTPGLARTALPAEGWHGRAAAIAFLQAARFTPWTPIFNLTGQPAISIPAGIGADRMPLSVQLVGAPGGEAILYALAAQLEAEQPWSTLSPPLGPD